MNKLLLAVTFIMIGMFAASCSKDNDKESNDSSSTSIVGTWVKTYEKETKWTLSNGEWVKSKESEEYSEDESSALYFGADGAYYKMYRNSNGNWEKSTVSTYITQGDMLILTYDSSSSKSRTFKVNGSILEITEMQISQDQKEEEVKRYKKIADDDEKNISSKTVKNYKEGIVGKWAVSYNGWWNNEVVTDIITFNGVNMYFNVICEDKTTYSGEYSVVENVIQLNDSKRKYGLNIIVIASMTESSFIGKGNDYVGEVKGTRIQ